ncbi:MAG: carbonate dehydratase [Phycisphaeraceae bacterium]|nr:carbonate dehydratase [Phycisphaeraceae bacterium]
MRTLSRLFANNRAWSESMLRGDPEFFRRLLNQQRPEYLWIGCADSRVPANQIVGLLPGDLFVHRNVANIVVEGDINCLSVLQYAVDVLRVRHVIVCGHYGCGGVGAALRGDKLGLADQWLDHVAKIRDKNRDQLDHLPTEKDRHDRLCELNVIEQVSNVCRTPIIREAWARSQPVSVHGWIYSLEDGLLRDMNMCVTETDELRDRYEAARQTRPVAKA